MLNRIRTRLTYANVMSTVAVFIALGGSSYAALIITGKNVKNGSLTGRDIKPNTIGAKQVKESRLGPVPRAETLNGVTGRRFIISCPDGTFPAGGTCIEEVARRGAAYGSAVLECASGGASDALGRRLPTHGELQAAFSRVDPAPGGELTGHVYPRADGGLDVLTVVSKTAGTTAVVPNDGNVPRAFRCAVDPLN